VLAESFTKAFLKINLDELPKFGNFDLLNLKTIKMGRNTSVSLGNYFEDFVDTKVSQGRFKNASEVIRAGLRLLEEEENKIQILKKAIQDGIDSGIAKDFDPKKHLESLKAKMKNNG
jgi:antitoxin ParD1/3/4